MGIIYKMSYPRLVDLAGDDDIKQFWEDLLHRKEFWQLKGDEGEYNFRDPAKSDTLIDNYLQIHSHQLFVRNFVNPHTPYDRLLLAHKTGTGKTLAAVAIARTYIDIFKQIYKLNLLKYGRNLQGRSKASKHTPTVFFIGFTKNNIINELLKHPELGFITISERQELDNLQKMAKNSISDTKRYREYYNSIKKRIVNKNLGGFYEFYGYQELVNKLFISEDISLTDLEKQANKFTRVFADYDEDLVSTSAESAEANRPDEPEKTLEDLVREKIAEQKIQLNYELLSRFEDSLIICDEAHYMYNSVMKNNYGVAIQYIIDTVKNCKLLLLTATPINNMAPEIIDVLNFLLPKDRKLNKKDFFISNREPAEGAIDKIARLSFGRVSFLQDVNPVFFPAKKHTGQIRQLAQEYEGFTEIPYIKFIECPMSDYQLNTYKHFLAETGQQDITNDRIIVPTSDNLINDIAFPNPESSEYGLYNTNKIRSLLFSADAEWRRKIGVEFYSPTSNINIVSGRWLHGQSLEHYSTKYAQMVNILENIFEASRAKLAQSTKESGLEPNQVSEKIIINHNNIRFGVMIIQEILKGMNILDEYSSPTNKSKCVFCGGSMGGHAAFIKENGLRNHNFAPARFVMIHSEIDNVSIENSFTKFNAPDNTYGGNYLILVGSKMISESHDMKNVRHMILTSTPVSIPKLNQLLGRGNRKNSHVNLPQDMRTITIHTLITTLPKNAGLKNRNSAEEYKYLRKMSYYLPVQRILSAVFANSVDAIINRDIIMPPALEKEYFPNGKTPGAKPEALLSGLYFEPKYNMTGITAQELDLSTFISYGYTKEEVEVMMYIIKRLFIDSPVWRLESLWRAVRHPPFRLEINPRYFNKGNFIIAFNNFLEQTQKIINPQLEENLKNILISEKVEASLFFDPSNYYIYKEGKRHRIKQVDQYYVLFPVNMSDQAEEIHYDIDIFDRKPVQRADVNINLDSISKFISGYQSNDLLIKKFEDRFSQTDVESLYRALEIYDAGVLTIMSYQALDTIISVNVINEEKPDKYAFYKRLFEFFDNLNTYIYVDDIKHLTKSNKMNKQNNDIANENAFNILNKNQLNGSDEKITKDATEFDKIYKNWPKDIPIGLVDSNQATLYMNEEWVIFTRVSIGLQPQYVENDIIVGYYENFGAGKNKFKIRRPIHKIQNMLTGTNVSNVDIRNLEKGIVCETKNKNDLIDYAKRLGIDLLSGLKDKSRLKVRGKNATLKIKYICDIIKGELIRREIAERKKKSNIKYFYFWHDRIPVINTMMLASVNMSAVSQKSGNE